MISWSPALLQTQNGSCQQNFQVLLLNEGVLGAVQGLTGLDVHTSNRVRFTAFRPQALVGLLPRLGGIHTSTSQCNSNRTSVARIPRQKYARNYPVLLVRPDGSSIHIRYKEPRQILLIPVDINTLPESERKARLRRRDAGKLKPKQEVSFEDDFKLDDYRKFWKKK